MNKFLIVLLVMWSVGNSFSQNDALNAQQIFENAHKEFPLLNADDIAVDSISPFQDLYLVSIFANDAGYLFEYGYYKGERFTDWKEQSREILKNTGFDEDTLGTALMFNNFILNEHTSFLTEKPKYMPDSLAFKKPSARFLDNEIVCEAWVSKHSMMCSHPYSLMQSVFDLKGNLLSFRSVLYINIPCE